MVREWGGSGLTQRAQDDCRTQYTGTIDVPGVGATPVVVDVYRHSPFMAVTARPVAVAAAPTPPPRSTGSPTAAACARGADAGRARSGRAVDDLVAARVAVGQQAAQALGELGVLGAGLGLDERPQGVDVTATQDRTAHADLDDVALLAHAGGVGGGQQGAAPQDVGRGERGARAGRRGRR